MNKLLTATLKIIICGTLCLCLAGCFSPKYMKRQQYLLPVVNQPVVKENNYSKNILLAHVATAPQFDQLNFLYRISEQQYLTDYYNEFMVSIGQQLDAAELYYFRNHGHFYPVTSEDLTSADMVLNTHIVEMYADYRDHNNPKAVVAMRFVLVSKAGVKSRVLLDKTFCSVIPLKEKTTVSLLNSWNSAIKCIFMRATNSLNASLSK